MQILIGSGECSFILIKIVGYVIFVRGQCSFILYFNAELMFLEHITVDQSIDRRHITV
jgi:hypothetical protein